MFSFVVDEAWVLCIMANASSSHAVVLNYMYRCDCRAFNLLIFTVLDPLFSNRQVDRYVQVYVSTQLIRVKPRLCGLCSN